MLDGHFTCCEYLGLLKPPGESNKFEVWYCSTNKIYLISYAGRLYWRHDHKGLVSGGNNPGNDPRWRIFYNTVIDWHRS